MSPSEKPPTRLLAISDDIAEQCLREVKWSTWHVWDYCQNTTRPKTDDAFANAFPFGTCVDHAFGIAKRLRESLSGTELEPYLEHVHTLGVDTKYGTGRTPYHILAAITTPKWALVFDMGTHYKPFVVKLGGTFQSHGHLNYKGAHISERYYYGVLPGSPVPKLRWQIDIESGRIDEKPSVAFFPIGYDDAVERINFRIARETAYTKTDDLLPKTRCVVIPDQCNFKPLNLPAVQVNGKWWTVSCRVWVDWTRGTLTIQAPYVDWLQAEWADDIPHIKKFGMLEVHGPTQAVANITLDVKDTANLDERTEIAKVIGKELGLDNELFDRMVKSLGKDEYKWC